LKEDEMRLFRRVFDIMFATVPNPDLLIYLYSDTARLLENIRKRGRRYEQGIEQSYLNAVQTKYLEHLRQQEKKTRILVLDVTNVDFVKNKSIYEQIKNSIYTPRNIGLTHEVL
jgi:deoxyadenosine/deoxycytidine kinase